MTISQAPKTSGKSIMIAVFGGVLLFSVIVLIGVFYLSPDPLPCASNAEAENPESQPGVPLPREQRYDDIDGAARFICHSVAYPRDDSLQLSSVTGFRTSHLKDVIEGRAYSEARLEFAHTPSGRRLQLNVSPQDLGPPAKTAQSQTVRIQGNEGLITRGGPSPDYIVVDWRKDGLSFHAQTQLGDGLSQEQLLALLETTR